MYRFEAVNKGKVGYRYRVKNIVTNIVYGLFSPLIYTEIVLIFGIELVIGNELDLV